MNSTRRTYAILIAAIALASGSYVAMYWPHGTRVIESTATNSIQAVQPGERNDTDEPRPCDALSGITTSCVYG